MNPALEQILTRSSIRKFTGAPIPEEDLNLIIRAGMAAPSAMNLQPWSFLAATEPAVLSDLCRRLPHAKMLDSAGAALIVCGDTGKDRQSGSKYWVIDCSAASQNILLAAHSLGYGAVWTAVYPDQALMETVREICGLPDGILPLNVIPLGTPAGDAARPKDKFRPEKIHLNRW